MFEGILANLIFAFSLSVDKNVHGVIVSKAKTDLVSKRVNIQKNKEEIAAIIVGARELCLSDLENCTKNGFSLSKNQMYQYTGPVYPSGLSGNVEISGSQNSIRFVYNGKQINATIF